MSGIQDVIVVFRHKTDPSRSYYHQSDHSMLSDRAYMIEHAQKSLGDPVDTWIVEAVICGWSMKIQHAD